MENPEQRCGSCGIARHTHWIVNHPFVETPYLEIFCPLCRMMIHHYGDNFERHYRNCGMQKPYDESPPSW